MIQLLKKAIKKQPYLYSLTLRIYLKVRRLYLCRLHHFGQVYRTSYRRRGRILSLQRQNPKVGAVK